MGSLLVLRDQANAVAPNRSRASDGLVGDPAHAARDSDHNPHPVPGVGAEMVTALDLTHDPGNGFDSYAFAEVLRLHRDARIKYVISNHRSFNSGTWTWHDYTGDDPHTNHVHISVLDAPISDTRTAWNLEGFTVTTSDVIVGESQLWDKAANRSDSTGRNFANDVYKVISDSLGDEFSATDAAMAAGFAQVAGILSAIQSKLDAIEAKVNAGGTAGGPVAYTFSGTATPKV